jgi:pyruvate ferredoxin oxidoreductase gamma subunit
MQGIIAVRLHGRGGQGTVTAAELLAVAAFYDGKFSQAFPNFGVERRGAPVMAFCRISDRQIRIREQIYQPDFLIIQDKTLVDTTSEITVGIEKCKGILVNSEGPIRLRNKRVMTVPATSIALEKIGKPFINTALMGAFVAMSELVSVKALEKALSERFQGEILKKNLASMKAAFEYVKREKEKYEN